MKLCQSERIIIISAKPNSCMTTARVSLIKFPKVFMKFNLTNIHLVTFTQRHLNQGLSGVMTSNLMLFMKFNKKF